MIVLIALALLLIGVAAFTCMALNCFMTQEFKKSVLYLAATAILLLIICITK